MEAEHGTEAQQRYNCPYCDFASRNKHLLIKHCNFTDHVSGANLKLAPFRKVERHSNKPFDLAATKGKEQKVCPVCELGLEGERALKSHQKLHQTGFKYECMFCLMGFEERERLVQHRSIHTNHFECLTCSDEFDRWGKFRDNNYFV